MGASAGGDAFLTRRFLELAGTNVVAGATAGIVPAWTLAFQNPRTVRNGTDNLSLSNQD